MKLITGNGYQEVYQLENANGQTIPMVIFEYPDNTYCSYLSEINDRRISARVFEKSGLRFCGTLYKYSNKTMVCVDSDKRPIFFVPKEALTTDKFAVDFLVE